MPLCTICDLEQATSKCTTCQRCRSYIHRWANQNSSRVVQHFDALRIRQRRMSTFAVVKDEKVNFVDFKELQENKVLYMSARELRRKAAANMISIKKAAELMRRRTA